METHTSQGSAVCIMLITIQLARVTSMSALLFVSKDAVSPLSPAISTSSSAIILGSNSASFKCFFLPTFFHLIRMHILFVVTSLTQWGSLLSWGPFMPWSADGWGLDGKLKTPRRLCQSIGAARRASPVSPTGLSLLK